MSSSVSVVAGVEVDEAVPSQARLSRCIIASSLQLLPLSQSHPHCGLICCDHHLTGFHYTAIAMISADLAEEGGGLIHPATLLSLHEA